MTNANASDNADFTVETVEMTCLAAIMHTVFAGVCTGPQDNRAIHDAWRNRLSISSDQDFYEALAQIRRSLVALDNQILGSPRINSNNRARHRDLVQGLMRSTELVVQQQQMASLHPYLNADRLHTLSTLADLLQIDDPRPLLPAEALASLIAALSEIEDDVARLEGVPDAFKQYILQQLDRIIWALKLAPVIGSDAVFEVAVQAFGMLRNPPLVPEAAAAKANGVLDRAQAQAGRFFKLLDTLETYRKRAVIAGYLAASSSVAVAGLIAATSSSAN